MPLFDERVQKQVRSALKDLQGPVRLVMFTQREGGALECAFCGQTRELVEEIAAFSDQISVEVRDFQADAELAQKYGIDKIPAIVVETGGPTPKDHGIRFYGIPSGYEFSSFIEALRMVSQGDAGLSAATRDAISKLTRPVRIQVFVTPT